MTANDHHLVYIGSADGPGGLFATRYDVYLRGGGPQLGWVYRASKPWSPWVAVSGTDRSVTKVARTRWQAATALWPAETVERAS